MNQEQLIDWLKPNKYIEGTHKIIKSKYSKYCVICQRKIHQGEYCTYNFQKKTIKHINCNDEIVMKREKRGVKYKNKTMSTGLKD